MPASSGSRRDGETAAIAHLDGRRRALDVIGVAVAIGAVVGIVLAPALLFGWVFLLAFGLAPLPSRGYRCWRNRR